MPSYGFTQLRDLLNAPVAENLQLVTDAIALSVAEHNRQMDSLLALFANRTTQYKGRYAQVGANRLQPLDENGRARPVVPSGYYDIALPIRDAGTAWGATFKAKELMTVADADRITAMMINGDAVWVRDQVMGALFASATHTFIDDQFGSLTVQPLANGDSVTYLKAGTLSGATDTHQLAQAAAIADANDPYPTIYDELTEHPENSGDVVALISTSLVATTKALTGFNEIADPNIAYGGMTDRLIGTLDARVPGKVIGYHDAGVWIAEWGSVPSGYIIATVTGGERPLGMREYSAASLQGFIQVPDDRNDHPFYERQYVRYAGFGAWNRVGALAYRIGNGTYAVPTGYTPPVL